MAANSSVVLEGLLKPDGTLELKSRPALPPGPVRVQLEVLRAGREGGPLPDPPWPDESISPPFDLPRPSTTERVQVREIKERFPDPFALTDEAGA